MGDIDLPPGEGARPGEPQLRERASARGGSSRGFAGKGAHRPAERGGAVATDERPPAEGGQDPRSDGFYVGLLRGFELRRHGAVVALPLSVQRLVAFLALSARPLYRVHVAGALWLEATEEHANACLRTALWRLRQLNATVVSATATHLALSETARVDMRETAARATEILRGGAAGDDTLLVLSRAGELLPDWYDDWVLIERERLRQLVIRSLERLSSEAAAAGRFAEATEAGLAAVAQEPLRESAHRLVVRAHLAEGNAIEAIRQYAICSQLLRDKLGVAPSADMRMLVRGLPLGDDRVT